MFELSVISLVIILYLTPLNRLFFSFSNSIFMMIFGESFLNEIHFLKSFCISIIYIILSLILLSIIRLALKYILIYFRETRDKDFDVKEILYEYKKGQGYINVIAVFIIVIVLITHILFRIYDVRIFLFGVLSIVFVFTSKGKPKKKIEKINEDRTELISDDPSRTEELIYNWKYRINPLEADKFINFTAKIKYSNERYREYQSLNHLDSSAEALNRYVLDGKCPEIVDLANQIKKSCRNNGFNTLHTVNTVMSFQQSFRYKFDHISKDSMEYVRYPLETLVDREGDCDCHAVCAATILSIMGYSVILLRIIFKDGGGHLAFAIEGADGLPGEFFDYDNKKYYYCEATPSNDKSSMDFRIGNMPDLSEANIDFVPLTEVVSI